MYTLITYPSAISFWMNNNPKQNRVTPERLSKTILIKNTNSEYNKRLADQLHLYMPLHLMISKNKNRKVGSGIFTHILPERLPDESIVEIAPSVWVISPELTFLLAANKLPFPKLVMTAMHLCGTYYYANGIQKFRDPLVSTQKLHLFLEKASNISGVRKARTALQFAADLSNSPAETKLSVFCRLPLHRGGCAALSPEMNMDIILSKEGRALLHRASCSCDLVWPEQKVILEYDSKQFHMDEDHFAYDKNKSSALNMSGFRVINVTNANLKSPETIEELFVSLRKALKIRNRPERFSKYQELRRNTIKEIFYEPEDWQVWKSAVENPNCISDY